MVARTAEADKLLHELTARTLGEVIDFSASVAEEFDSLIARGLFGLDINAQKYPRLFSNGPPKAPTTGVNQMVLSLGALSFFLHAIDRLSYRQRSAIFDPVAISLAQTFAEMLNTKNVKTTGNDTLYALQSAYLRYADAPTLLGQSAQDKNSAARLATHAIAKDVGHPGEVFSSLMFGKLLDGIVALDLANRIAALEAVL